MIHALWFRLDQGSGIRVVQDSGFMVCGLWFMVDVLSSGVQGVECRVQGVGCRE